jgi:hypothetical protein
VSPQARLRDRAPPAVLAALLLLSSLLCQTSELPVLSVSGDLSLLLQLLMAARSVASAFPLAALIPDFLSPAFLHCWYSFLFDPTASP